MTNLYRLLFLGFLSLGFSTQVYGKTIADVQSASCTSAKGGYLMIDVPQNILSGQFGTLNEMKGSDDPDTKIELLVDYPDDGFTALGALAIDSVGYWGNLSLIALNQQQLSAHESLNAFFTDVEGNNIVEPMDCDLVFN